MLMLEIGILLAVVVFVLLVGVPFARRRSASRRERDGEDWFDSGSGTGSGRGSNRFDGESGGSDGGGDGGGGGD